MSMLQDSEVTWKIGLVLLAVAAVYTVLSLTFPKSPLNQSFQRGRRIPTARTPRQSISPDTKQPTSIPPTTGYEHILPPQRRGALSLLPNLSIPRREVPETQVLQTLLPMASNYENSKEDFHTPTGFSMDEIHALGDFPDYAALSGVPLPGPYLEHDIQTARPRPYRPFRWSYHQTMSLTKLQTDWWIELENTYKARIAQRKELFARNGKSVLDALPGSELACKELMEMVIQFICARYPQHFMLENKRILHNHILGTQQDVRAKPPLEVLLDNVPEDFALMMRDEQSGHYFLRAAVVCSALGWNVQTKIGKQLQQIHAPIPDYKEKMQFSMDRFFTKMPTDKPIQRGSWGLEVGEPLYMPPGDPHEALRKVQDPALKTEECTLRVDWQTLRRLPLSASIVFNFKALFTPVTEFRDEPCVPALVAKILKEGKHSLMEYKAVWHVQHVLLPQLEEWIKEQAANGLMPEKWQVSTLEDSPWFKGWEEKWHRQQGF